MDNSQWSVKSTKKYAVWRGYAGQSDPGMYWYVKDSTPLTLQQIGNNESKSTITHMSISGSVPPDLHGLAPHLTHLSLSFLSKQASSTLNWIGELTDLQELRVWNSDHLVTLPDSIEKLHKLKYLKISNNCNLKSLPRSIRMLKSLKQVDVQGCASLRSPPKEVCERGWQSIRQYFKDMASGSKDITPAVTVAVIGRTMAGKTSLIKTLQNEAKQRVLTNRAPDAVVDEATKVFKVEQVKADDVLLRFIDVGGHDVYHTTYQLTFRNSCIVLSVVNIEEYRDMRYKETLSSREAARLLCFDWLSQMYLACPNLDSPKLVFTHSDKFPSDIFEQLKSEFLESCQSLKDEVVEAYKALNGNIGLDISHFNKEKLFDDTDIYSIGSNSRYSVFEELLDELRAKCLELSKQIPIIWEKISKVVDSCGGVFVSIDKVRADLKANQKFLERPVGRKQLEIVLTYLVDCGKVLWYPNIADINQYIFHRIEKVTNLIATLFVHDEDEKWKKRLERFAPCSSLAVERERYALMVEVYKESGIMAAGLLGHLIKSETEFSDQGEVEVALTVLSNFRLVFGPVLMKGQECFILPYFCSGYQSGYLETAEDQIRLHADVAFKGLTVPCHVFHQISIGVMHDFPKTTDYVALKKNGLTVYHDGISLSVTHDFKSQKVDLELTGISSSLSKMWDMLISVRAATEQHLKENWKAARFVTTIRCAHCLLVKNPHPAKIADPDWQTRVDPMTRIKCKSDIGVPACLNHPCKALNRENIDVLAIYIKDHKSQDNAKCNAGNSTQIIKSALTKLPATGEVQYSDGSDSDESITPSTGEPLVAQILQSPSVTEPTLESNTHSLVNNTDKVFKMTHPIRGRALVMNMENFRGTTGQSHQRKGSDQDVREMKKMLEAFKFEVVIRQDCSAQDIITDIITETQSTDHEDYGMFFLCIMSHGKDDGVIMGSDLEEVRLTEIYDTLSPTLFPAMAGKPKVIVIQACSGIRKDEGAIVADTPSEPSFVVEFRETTDEPRPRLTPKLARVLNVDDFFIIRSSFDSYISLRNEQSGSLLIKCLVKTFYEHAGRKDMYSLYKIIQEGVREESMKLTEQHLGQCSGQTVIAIDTLSRQRKLYLFPGYNPQSTHPQGSAT